jgi:hypothetical protein
VRARDDPSLYYAAPQADWSLGDLVIVPAGVLWAQGERPSLPYPQPAPPPDASVSVVYDLWTGSGDVPTPAIECWVTPAVIVVDDCVIDKEFNAFVDRRIREGAVEAEAIAEARTHPELDPLVPITPLLPYSRLRFANPQAVRQAQPIGYFPVVASDEVDEGYLDFTRTVAVSRRLLWGPAAAMSEPARRILRWKLAQFYAVRNFSVDAEIMAALGRTITAVRTVIDNRDRLVVDLELDHGASELRLRQEPRRPDLVPGHQRGRPT